MHRIPALIAPIALATVFSLGTPLADGGGAAGTDASVASKPRVSPEPQITVVAAGGGQEARLVEAVARFTELGLLMPDLEVRFSDDPLACDGHPGLFESSYSPWRISICSTLDFVFEHELAHAWERANLDDTARKRFMDLRGISVWNDSGMEWAERGVEQVAFVVQQNLLGSPLRKASEEWQNRLDAFELLTGVESPRRP